MKKLYILLTALILGSVSYGQDVLTEINVNSSSSNNPSTTGNIANVSSIGLTRGTGASYDSGDDYAVAGLNAPDNASAITNDDYIQFSISANATYELELSQLEIKLGRRDTEGPTRFRIYSSTDGFATAGTALLNSNPSELNADGSTTFQTKGRKIFSYDLNLNSGVEGTVTFRMYAWGGSPSDPNNALIKVFASASSPNNEPANSGNVVWTDYVSGDAGVRITGSVTSAESNIVATAFDPTDNIDYTAYSASSGLTNANAIKIAEFSIQDGGDDLSDADLVGTTLTSLGFNIPNFNNLAALAIFDGSTNVSEVSSVTASTNFSAINSGAGITATDNAAKTFSVYATFKNTVTDNQQIQLTIESAAALASGSNFASPNAGAAATPVVGDDNRIEVIATNLIFNTNPPNFVVNAVVVPAPSVNAIDPNANTDLDFTGAVALTPSTAGIFDPGATTTVSAVSGLATFSNIGFDTIGTGYTLQASSGSLTVATSTSFNISAAPGDGFIINAINDENIINFDTTVPGVNNGTFTGTGIVKTPANGQLDSDAWQTSGMSDGPTGFALNFTTGDYARGTSTGAVTTGGFYSFEVAPSNYALGVQATDDDFTPGTVVLKTKNNTGSTVTKFIVQYKVYVYNDQNNSNSLNFAYSNNNTSYTGVTGLNFTSPSTASTTPSWEFVTRTAVIDGINIPNGSFFYLRWRGNDVSGTGARDEFAIDDIQLNFQPVTLTTYTYDNSIWTPDDPSGSINPSNIIIVQNGNANISADTNADSVNIAAGASLTVNSNATLNATQTTLESSSTLFSSLILEQDGADIGAILGGISYERYTNVVGSGAVGTGGNDLLSLPLMSPGQTFADFITFGDPQSNASVLPDNGIFYAFGPYNNAAQTYVNFGMTAATPLERGKGYRAASKDVSNNRLTFSGTIETGSVSRTINTPIGGNQWNLIGNPYPSYVTSTGANSFLNAANIAALDPSAAAIYGYNNNNGPSIGTIGNFTIINGASNASVNIAPGQGFFVANNTAAGTNSITFDYDMATTTGTDDFILGRDATESYNLRLKASSGATDFATEIYFNSNSGLGLDPGYDAALMSAFASNFMIYSHLVENNEGRNMAIQSLGTAAVNEVIIPLGLKASQGQQVTIGMELSSLPADVQVYLEDNLNNTFTLLNTGDYTFTADSAIDGTGRFFLRTSNSTLSTTAVDVAGLQMYTNNDTLFVKGLLNANTAVNLYDLQGRLVLNTQLDKGSNSNQVDVSNMTTGVYIVTLSNATQQKTQKVIIK
ncbi:T9SS type A sorting domain-containing protein [Subsaximicrobium wynnwilliamsii]|uniref:T9SS type A sorting domain-containing protein n=1 Tax=Subsaximicrobium wynnwilliamsii TaxID=291179 RepID=A0A5C6ZG37_9FLAO|nr:T9SS type A sorting domain-containing protein [Subsaximicrobium wynnwilliamsii]TXD81346.1 T9SS type A sorting domain-containing protein [Subsaximicrobium wynnwilliamsii]TXD89042.1 T9SS type A sorting domain-containing protein [Subsaximicrobium wynnwilliamsii]TXE00720.1 T9SS type A sorting domain-containing protein [Subsaximicrobium wynnwilliamsii]